jgi:SSS family solute:Na+ symporter
MATPYKDSLQRLENTFNIQQTAQQGLSKNYVIEKKENYKDSLRVGSEKWRYTERIQSAVLKKALPADDTSDTNYIFLRFVVDFLPKGIVGLLIAIIFLAAWGSIAAALNSLASCTMVDFHVRFRGKKYDSSNTAMCG